MQLALAVPEMWPLRVFDNGRRCAIVPGHSGTPDLVVDIDPLVPVPDELRTWVDFAVRRDTPAGSRMKLVNTADTHTVLGWPVQLVHAVVLAGAAEQDKKDQLIEVRLAAFYKFNEWAGHAMVRGTDVTRWEEHRPKLLEVLHSARPDWRGPFVVAAIADLFR